MGIRLGILLLYLEHFCQKCVISQTRARVLSIFAASCAPCSVAGARAAAEVCGVRVDNLTCSYLGLPLERMIAQQLSVYVHTTKHNSSAWFGRENVDSVYAALELHAALLRCTCPGSA